MAALTEEVGDGFEGLLLAHDEADSLRVLVAHQFAVADTTLFPLLLSESVQLNAHLENALKGLSARLDFHLGKVNLGFGLLIGVLDVVFCFIFNFGWLSRV